MKRFNLLPVDLKDKHRRRRLNAVLLIIQILIVIFAAASFPLLNLASSYIRTRSEQLTVNIAGDKYIEAGRIADELSRVRGINSAAAYLNDLLSPKPIDSEWLAAVNSTIPEGVELEKFEITGGRIIISCLTDELPLVEEHRLCLAGEGFFPIIGKIASLSGKYRYAITASV
jgi:Tfp pilus assembly protein PilN